MPIVQVPLDVPDEIYTQVLNGSLNLMGMVKDNQNKVRKHIPTAKLSQAQNPVKINKSSILQNIKKPKNIAIGIGFAAAMGVGTYAYHSWKKNKKNPAEEKVMIFQKALKEYLKASKKGKLNTEVVDNLLASLNAIEEKQFGKDIELSISASQFTALIYSIFTYTESLAKDNSFDVKIMKPKHGTKGNIISLKSYLEIQKQILENAA